MKHRPIECNLPPVDISEASAQESIRHGHSSTPHIWWARQAAH